MKTLALIIVTFLISATCHAQNVVTTTNSTVQDFNKYLSGSILFPAVDMENNTEGIAVLTFKIDKDGKIGDIEFVKHLTATCDSAVTRVLRRYNKTIAMPLDEYTVGFKFITSKKEMKSPKPIQGSDYHNYLFDVYVKGVMGR